MVKLNKKGTMIKMGGYDILDLFELTFDKLVEKGIFEEEELQAKIDEMKGDSNTGMQIGNK